ncbi:MAG: HIT family protein [Dehalococcoidia bacterium]
MKTDRDCILCRISGHEAESHILYESEQVIAMLDLFPATRGHTLVLPKSHVPTIYEMPMDTGMEIMKTAILLAKAIKLALHPEGLNLIQANGKAGGQTIDHFHLHIVPRYRDDGVVLRFGHGSQSANPEELAEVASIIRL